MSDHHVPAVAKHSKDGEWLVYCVACSEKQQAWVTQCEEPTLFTQEWPPHILADAAYKRTIERKRRKHRVDDNVIAMSHTPTDTQRQAAAIALPRAGSKRRRLYDLFLHRGVTGITDDEIELMTGWTHQSASACRNVLMNEGFLVDSGERRSTSRGTKAIVWRITPTN
jgi:hypothetical protein